MTGLNKDLQEIAEQYLNSGQIEFKIKWKLLYIRLCMRVSQVGGTMLGIPIIRIVVFGAYIRVPVVRESTIYGL